MLDYLRANHPITNCPSWKAADFLSDDRWLHRLSPAEIEEIDRALDICRAQAPNLIAMTKADFPLPTLSAVLAEMRGDLNDRFGFTYLRGLPHDRYGLEDLQRIYWGVSLWLGDPLVQNRNGHMLGHVIDVGDKTENLNKRLTQSNVELAYHSDGCDYVGLLCVRTAKAGGESMIVNAAAVHNEMLRRAPELCSALYDCVLVDRRGEIPAGKEPWMPIPVFMFQNDTFNAYAPLRAYIDSARRFEQAPATTDLQWQALDLFREICNDPEFSIRIPFEPGDIQYLHNHLVFHARTGFEDWPDLSKRRHLLRIWLSAEQGRELHPALKERWVNIERGTRRGGVNIPNSAEACIPETPDAPAYA